MSFTCRHAHSIAMTTHTDVNMNTNPSPLEDQLRCCICLDTYTDPVSIPCGHNFCLDCIEGFWDTKAEPECPLCKETFGRRPDLRINRVFSDIVEIYKRSLLAGLNQEEEVSRQNHVVHADDVPCDICCGNKSTSVKSCLTCQASFCTLHLAPHLREPALKRHQLTDPATFPSSHLCRNHNKPLTLFCTQDQSPVCESCTKTDHRCHKTVVLMKEGKKIKAHLKSKKISIQQMIQARLRKMEQIKESTNRSKKMTERQLQSSTWVCRQLMAFVQRQQAALVEELEERQQEAERRAEELLHQLQQEINQLQTRTSELQDLELDQNPLHLLQSFPSVSELQSSRDWSEVPVHSDNCVETVSRGVSRIVDFCQELANKASAEEVNKMEQYAVDITLDPDTASGWLLLAPDAKKVSVSSQRKKLPDLPQRFNLCVCVLGKESFTCGRRYFVVQVGDKTDWDLGLAAKSVNRKGSVSVQPDSGFWAICRRKGGDLSACAGPSVPLHLRDTPQKVGIFLDYEEGSVSFYDAEAKTHIYTYSGCTFTEPLYPYFNPCVPDNGKNTSPLVICPLEGQVREGQDITIDSDL